MYENVKHVCEAFPNLRNEKHVLEAFFMFYTNLKKSWEFLFLGGCLENVKAQQSWRLVMQVDLEKFKKEM